MLVFALDSLKDLFSPLPVSPAAEILWILFHSQMGPVLLSCWYRPPCYGEVESIITFASEWNSYSSFAVGTVVVGNLNIHNKKWLYVSRNTSPEGFRMQQWCSERGFRERVQKPTRGPNLLDLVLTDMPDHVSTVVLPELADHRLVMVSLSLPPLSLPSSSRACWKYAQANWRGLKRFFRSLNWQFLRGLSSDGAVRALTRYILTAMHTFIPRVVVQNASSHPWLNADCVEHIRRKTETAGTSDFPFAVRACSRALLTAFHSYSHRTKRNLQAVRTGSKGWWSLSRSLMEKVAKSPSPPLRSPSGSWIVDPRGKACLFAQTFLSKWAVPDLESNSYSPAVSFALPPPSLPPVRLRHAQAILKDLRADSGTGPDLIPARVLKSCCAELGVPFVFIVRLILNTGQWPRSWMLRWIQPLHKRFSQHDPGHYRGIHLTSQMSKAAERLLCSLFVPPLLRSLSYGVFQFAYTPGRGARDAILYFI